MAKTKGRNEGTPDPMQQVLTLLQEQTAISRRLEERIIDLETAKAGSVPILQGPVPSDVQEAAGEVPRVEYAGDEPDLGPIFMCRVYSHKVPHGQRDVIPVTLGSKDRRGRWFKWRRRIVTDMPIPLPEDIIRHLETPSTDVYEVPPQTSIYQAWLQGDLKPAEADCRKKGFDRLQVTNHGVKYVRYVRYYTVSKEGEVRNGVLIPEAFGYDTRGGR